MLNEFIDFKTLNIALAYPFIFLIIIAIILLFCSAFYKLHRSFYTSISILSLIFSFFLILSNMSAQGIEAKAFLDTLRSDIISFYASCIILFFSFLYLLMDREKNKSEFYPLFLFMVSSLLLLVSSSNLILIFIALEGSSLALYTLIAMRGTQNAISSGIKYFSVAAVGAGFFTLACALFYMKTGSLDLNSGLVLKNEFQKDPLFLSIGVIIFILCAIKLSLIPFHFWLKDVYYAAHTNLVAFISIVPKVAILVVILRIFNFMSNLGFEYIIMIIAVFSMILAAISSLSQKDIKKMLAYSSVVHSSFVLCALIPLLRYNQEDFSLSLIPIFGYWVLFAFANYAVFLILSLLRKSSYENLQGILSKRPLIAICLGVCVLSLAGIPPFGVFWGKVMILKSVIENGYGYLALFIALSSMIMLYAYLKIIINAFFIKKDKIYMTKLNFRQNLVLILCIGINIFALFFML